MMLPDVLLALWLKLLTDGVLDGDRQAMSAPPSAWPCR